MEMPNMRESAVICQAILLILSLVFLYLTISCYSYYMANLEFRPDLDKIGSSYVNPHKTPYNLIYKSTKSPASGSLPNMPAGFAIATAISMLGVAVIEVGKMVIAVTHSR